MRKRTIWITAALLVVLTGAAGAYLAIGTHYATHFFERVTINGIDVSDLTAQEAEKLIARQAEDYRVTLQTKEGAQEIIEGADIGYRFVSGGEVQGFLEEQNFLLWLPAYLGDAPGYTMEASVTYDEAKLEEAVSKLSCMQEDKVTKPQDASLTRQENGTYVITPETEGNLFDKEKLTELVKQTVDSGNVTADLAAGDCYVKPSVYADDGKLKAEAAVRNRYAALTVTYQMGGGITEVLDAGTINGWFSLDDELQPVFDREAVAAWVNQLADRYDTIGAFLPFVTSNGETVYPESRTYGWQMDRETETEELYQQLLSGEPAQRSPVWMEGAWSRGENDIGNTYVEIDYTNQRMWYYKDGALLVETPVVTGNVGADMASPEGVFCLVGKEENATLVGEDYKTPVDYWMPFYGGVGIHDADSWRTAYGGDIYLWGGSHGCINTPTAQAAVIFQNIEVGTPIVCYSSGTNYGYGQTGSGAPSGGADSDVVIVDGPENTGDTASQNGADAGAGDAAAGNGADAGAGDAAAGNGADAGAGDAAAGNGADVQTPQTEFPITIEDEWADESQYYEETVIF